MENDRPAVVFPTSGDAAPPSLHARVVESVKLDACPTVSPFLGSSALSPRSSLYSFTRSILGIKRWMAERGSEDPTHCDLLSHVSREGYHHFTSSSRALAGP